MTDNPELIGSYYGCSIAKINSSGTQIIITSYIDISQVPDFTPKWLQEVYGAPSCTVIQKAPPGYEPDLPKRGAPTKRKKAKE